ncbi:MAG: hypothetical protein LIP03_14925 [Bacteroidales bacterium]|nr:hypothetical protein [Bacteroidales bacterium]
MVDKKMVIYMGKDSLETLAIFDDDYPNLHNIIKNHSILCLNLTDEELDDILLDPEGDISQFCLKNNIPLIALDDYFKALKEEPSQIAEKPRSMFFFDISPEEAETMSNKYGVIVQSENKIDDNILQLSFRKNLDKGEVIEGDSDGWSNLFAKLSLPPCNSLVISDNYLLQNEEEGVNIGYENLKMLLNAILPKMLAKETTFHLLIVTPMPLKISSEKADQLNGCLKSFLKTIRPYEFQLEFVFNDTLHPRKIISNYYVIVCDKGFKLFHPKRKNTVKEDNEVSLLSVFHAPAHSIGDTIFEIASKDIDKIKKSCITLRDQILGGVKDPTKKIIGDVSKNKTIRNRLMS